MSKNILLVQADRKEAKAVADVVTGSNVDDFQVEWLDTYPAAIRRLDQTRKQVGKAAGGIAAVVLDMRLPSGLGSDTIKSLFEAAPRTPFLILVGAGNEELANLAVRRGAQAYFLERRPNGDLLPEVLNIMIDRADLADAEFAEKERAEVTLSSIGDAVLSTDALCNVSYLNPVAERLTGLSRAAAVGRPVDEVLRIVEGTTRQPVVNPMKLAISEDRAVALAPNCVVLRPDGTESPIDDSAAPIHDRQGRVVGAVMVFHDVSAARALSLSMLRLAKYDSLTELPNRLLLDDRLAQAVGLAQRHGTSAAVLYIDVDRFKHVNDSFGHTVGDHLLKSVASRLLSCVRSSDTVSRLGGDEFVVLLSEFCRAEDAGLTAEKMLLALGQPHHFDGMEVHISASIGIATFPKDGSTAEALLKNADAAMYRAKDCGRNNYQFFKREMNIHADERHELEREMHHALGRSEFVVHYQPKVNLRTGAISGMEALVRWEHPARRPVGPDVFVPIAEACGLIVPIGNWVLREACRQARSWHLAGAPWMEVSVNTSAVELRVKNYVEGVRAALAESGLPPGHLELEITETCLLQDSVSMDVVLQELKELGVRLALDDFGTGYSSLSYLKRFPIDTLKIDRSFVRDITTDAGDAGIVSAVINMGKSLRMRVVAEGVETREQCEFLREQRCPEAQGYFFGRPSAPRSFEGFLVQEAVR